MNCKVYIYTYDLSPPSTYAWRVRRKMCALWALHEKRAHDTVFRKVHIIQPPQRRELHL